MMVSSCVGKELDAKFDGAYVVLGLFCAFVGSFVALMMIKYGRQARVGKEYGAYAVFVVASGVELGGAAIWTMHFVGGNALVLKDCEGQEIKKSYEVVLTIASLVAAIICTAISVHVVMPVVKKGERIEKGGRVVSSDLLKAHSSTNKSDDNKYVLKVTFFDKKPLNIPIEMFDPWRFLASASFLTVAALIMHYTGQIAQHGPYTVRYDAAYVVLASLLGFVVASAGLFLVVQVSATKDVHLEFVLRVMAAFVIAGAVNTLHYVGMLGITYTLRKSRDSALTAHWSLHAAFEDGAYLTLSGANLAVISLAVSLVVTSLSQHYSATLFDRLDKTHKKSLEALPDNVQDILEEIYDMCVGNTEGKVADYIPELAKVDANLFGIALVDTKGELYKVGDCHHFATMQSVSKTLLYVMALCDSGEDTVDRKIGEEPSGRAFNEVSIDAQNRAFNPLINTGALVSTSLLKGDTTKARYHHFESLVRRCSCPTTKIQLNRAVYDSETKTNSQNRMITAELVKKGVIEERLPSDFRATTDTMRSTASSEDEDKLTASKTNEGRRSSRHSSGALPSNYGDLGICGAVALDAYTRICSLNISAVELAILGATFANDGANPMTDRQVIPKTVVTRLVNVMMSCGMYNGAGKWIVDVGIPAKSGVSGLLLCVVPGICGIAIYSPRLDDNGNSLRGIMVAEALSKKLGLHVLKKKGEGTVVFKSLGSMSDLYDTYDPERRGSSQLSGESRRGSSQLPADRRGSSQISGPQRQDSSQQLAGPGSSSKNIYRVAPLETQDNKVDHLSDPTSP